MNRSQAAVSRLAYEHPDWLPVLEAAVTVAAAAEPYGGEFAGAWVVGGLGRRGRPRRIPNLRILVSYGLLEKSGESTRSGRRAYYRMPDRTAVERALASLSTVADPIRRRLRFVGSGASEGEATNIGRQAGEIRYEPRSWR